ncbi:hypothetical protein ACUB3A_004609 [Klebsiella pneumoniae]|uniref:hypothetical protein n=1 Tax=Klebsiella pneumoniae TaxID=573 RepID=UPI00296C8FDF|nr:hypothetical protein [Klebsiella pneumoniae]HEF8916350.1 hypothetical protein [Klebsiella pneumoniae]HEF8942558.1 hypothetical protein [Klebsiella pneumoniae]HEG3575158.1 hypothetical protein [Klebsiella pneumoniae]HEG4254323.1 hypothetical protein [Klebsiella pneumoniae]
MSTLVYQNTGIVATRYLKKYPFPNDITQLPSLIPGIILQADFDVNDAASLTRNRVGAAMSVVGSPVLGDYGVNLTEANHLDTNIDIAAYNGSDLTMMTIAVHPGVVGAVVGRVQMNAPQRTRGIQTTATAWRAKWLTAAGAAQQADLTPSTAATDGEMAVSRFVRNNGSGSMLTKLDLPRTLQSATGTAATTPYAVPSSKILLGGSVEGTTTATIFMRACLIVSRAITDAEMATIYTYYKNYYQLKGKAI